MLSSKELGAVLGVVLSRFPTLVGVIVILCYIIIIPFLPFLLFGYFKNVPYYVDKYFNGTDDESIKLRTKCAREFKLLAIHAFIVFPIFGLDIDRNFMHNLSYFGGSLFFMNLPMLLWQIVGDLSSNEEPFHMWYIMYAIFGSMFMLFWGSGVI